jgi:hypothetical protein
MIQRLRPEAVTESPDYVISFTRRIVFGTLKAGDTKYFVDIDMPHRARNPLRHPTTETAPGDPARSLPAYPEEKMYFAAWENKTCVPSSLKHGAGAQAGNPTSIGRSTARTSVSHFQTIAKAPNERENQVDQDDPRSPRKSG